MITKCWGAGAAVRGWVCVSIVELTQCCVIHIWRNLQGGVLASHSFWNLLSAPWDYGQCLLRFVFFSPFSTDVWKWGLWTCEVASNTEPESCGRLSVALTRTKFLLPHSLETWRFMIAVVCLSLLWLRYLSQKKNPPKNRKPKQNKKEPTPDWAPHAAAVFHVSRWPLVSSDDREGEPILTMAGISWLADTSP